VGSDPGLIHHTGSVRGAPGRRENRCESPGPGSLLVGSAVLSSAALIRRRRRRSHAWSPGPRPSSTRRRAQDEAETGTKCPPRATCRRATRSPIQPCHVPAVPLIWRPASPVVLFPVAGFSPAGGLLGIALLAAGAIAAPTPSPSCLRAGALSVRAVGGPTWDSRQGWRKPRLVCCRSRLGSQPDRRADCAPPRVRVGCAAGRSAAVAEGEGTVKSYSAPRSETVTTAGSGCRFTNGRRRTAHRRCEPPPETPRFYPFSLVAKIVTRRVRP
jgi:hypothetical protein